MMADNKNQIFRNIHYCADVSGTGFWRHIAPITTANCVQVQTRVFNTYSQQPVCDPRFYVGMNSVVIQRWLTNEHRNFVEKFLRPLTLQTGTWLIYEIDDAMGAEDIPIYNSGHDAFQSPEVQDNIKYMLNVSDLVVVTTDYIRQYYHKRYGVPLERIIAVPNLLPRWWFGDKYDPQRKLAQFNHYKAKPRIGVISSLSHYNIRDKKDANGNPIRDDFDEIADTVRSTVDDFQWIIFGYAPPQVKDLIDQKKVMWLNTVPILSYPSTLQRLQLQAVVAPLQDNEFNRCKSTIKYLECCASGMPLFASNVIPYKGVVPEQFLFSTPDELKDKLLKMKFGSNGVYQKMIEQNWKWLNSPREDGNYKLNDSWLESNLGVWLQQFCLPRKSSTVIESKNGETNDGKQKEQELH